jgi:N-acetylglucosaminyldiphosphoundecaprenol N-acetyl-beta-D-mannosaminyltransferase
MSERLLAERDLGSVAELATTGEGTAAAVAASSPPTRSDFDWFGLPMARLTMDEAIAELALMLRGERPCHATVVNASVAVWCRWDPAFRALVAGADMRLCDGMGFMYASRLLGEPFPEMLSGPLVIERLVEHAAARGYPVFFLGSTVDVVGEAVRCFRLRYPGLRVAGLRDGFFAPEEEPKVVEQIRRSGARLLLVAMGSPREEVFIHRNLRAMGVPVCVDVGGAFEVTAGLRRLAPRWMRVAGLEWAYRLLQEPRRLWKRYATTLPVFAALVGLAWLQRLAARLAGRAPGRGTA